MLRDSKQALLLDVLVHPRASQARVGPVHAGRLKIAVTAPPTDGAANAAVCALVAKTLGVAKRAVSVVSGAQSRQKTLAISGLSRADVAAALGVGDADSAGPGSRA
ncbi:MAG: DUF167 family protein YggU [Haliangiales bacterium]